MTGPERLTRVCSSCGIQKPLSAFLEISSTRGTTYGNICATCRGAGITGKAPQKEVDDASTSRSGFKIDAKVRYQIELEKARQAKSQKDTHLQEQKKREVVITEKTERSETLQKSEKDSREKLFTARSGHDFLKTPPVKTETPVNRAAQTEMFTEKKRAVETVQRIETSNFQESKRKSTELGEGPFLDTAHTYEERLHGGSLYREFQQRLGPESAFLRNQKQKLQKLFTDQSKEATPQKDPTVEFVEKHLTPRSPSSKK